MIPEASAGCVCLFSIASTIVMEPREERTPWAIYSSVGSLTPVKEMTLNFGAPGDRRDQNGRIWLAYPRPRPSRTTGLDLSLDLNHKFTSGGGFEGLNAEAVTIEGHPEPWLFASTAAGLTQVTLPLLGKQDKPATYRVRLYFAELDKSIAPGQRVFDVRMQGKTVSSGLDVAAAAGGTRKAFVKDLGTVEVTGTLQIDLVPKAGKKPPILSAIEVERVDDAGDAAQN
jgi:hypothetical protein